MSIYQFYNNDYFIYYGGKGTRKNVDENNGSTFSYLVGGDRTQENFYYPQAGRHFMVRLLLKL